MPLAHAVPTPPISLTTTTVDFSALGPVWMKALLCPLLVYGGKLCSGCCGTQITVTRALCLLVPERIPGSKRKKPQPKVDPAAVYSQINLLCFSESFEKRPV